MRRVHLHVDGVLQLLGDFRPNIGQRLRLARVQIYKGFEVSGGNPLPFEDGIPALRRTRRVRRDPAERDIGGDELVARDRVAASAGRASGGQHRDQRSRCCQLTIPHPALL